MEETKDYRIIITCMLGQITVNKSLSDTDLDSFCTDVLKNGYAHVETGKTTIYPAHTINKMEMKLV